MGETFKIRDSERAVAVLRSAGFVYSGHGAGEAGKKESMTLGWIYHAPEDPKDPKSRRAAIRHNVATLWYGNAISLVHEDQPSFPSYHAKIKEVLGQRGLIQK